MILIIGAGISGLSLAYHLQKQNKAYMLLEASDRVGGYIRSLREGDYLFELGPNSLLCDAELEALIKELGIEERVLEANAVSKKRYIYRGGRYRQLPSSPPSLLFNSFFSWKAKKAILQELRHKPQTAPAEETLASFFERHFNKEIVDYALAPFVSGIYAGNVQALLTSLTFPQLYQYEATHGSIIKSLIKNKGAARKKTISFKNGLEILPRYFEKQLKSLYLNRQVNSIFKKGNKFIVSCSDGLVEADKLVLACPSGAASQFLANAYPDFTALLKQIEYAPMAAVHSVYPKKAVGFALDGFGALHPPIEGLFSLGSVWNSSVFQYRCKNEEVLFTTFVGGALGKEKLKLPDSQVLAKVQQELKQLYHIEAPPLKQRIFRWEQAIPQYTQSLLPVVAAAKALEQEQLFVCANWLGGVSLPDCIRKGKLLADVL